MRYKVQLPDYPCRHVVTGLTEGYGASGKRLLLAEAHWVRDGMGPHRTTDLLTQMLLHDAIASRTAGHVCTNNVSLYGRTKALRARAARRIALARVDPLNEIDSPSGETVA